MIVDGIFLLSILAAAISGYQSGFITTLFRTVGAVVGGVAGLYFSLNYASEWQLDLKKIGFIISAIFIAATLGSLVSRLISKGFRAIIIRGPLKFLDSIAGAALEVMKTAIILYLIATIVLYAPWNSGHSAIKASKIYLKIEALLPGLITQLKAQINLDLLKSEVLQR